MEQVFVTGGAGFLGRALLGRLAEENPSLRVTVYSRDERKQSAVRSDFPHHNYILGDVRDLERLTLAMAGHDTVIHAAAMKYVPQAERNVEEAIAVNVDGSRNVATAALRVGVDRVVGISTDKACRPVNVYGVTKLLMERVFQEADSWGRTQFNLVRYGNVIGSTGSVIPLFERQARAGRMTLTNPTMTRFWLTVQDAVDLIVKALDEPHGGTVLIPRLAATNMKTVAEAVIGLAHPDLGLSVAVAQTQWEEIGQRFGEKVHEELLTPVESIYTERVGSRLMRMWPVTEGERPDHLDGIYTSNTPDEWLYTTQMAAMIAGTEVPQ